GTLTGDDNPEQIKIASVTTNFFQVLGVQPMLGRGFNSEEQAGGRPAIILTSALWRRRFGADPNIIGKSIQMGDGQGPPGVGVLPDDFQLHCAADANVPPDVPAFAPFRGNLARFSKTLYYLRLVARLKPGVTVAQAQGDLDSVADQLRASYLEYAKE